MANKLKSPFVAQPGFIIARPYVSKDQTFVSVKESAGDAQQSEVISVGKDYIDDHGNKRAAEVEVGDIILHFYAQHTYEVGFDKYRAIHFSQVMGIMKK